MKLSDLFVGWYEYTDDEYNDMLKNSLISFDTNVLLNMYRYSKKASNETFDALKTIKDRILISYYVAKEFTNNRKKVRIDNIREYENLSKFIEDKFSDMSIELDKYGEKKLSKISDIKNALDRCKDRALKYINSEKQTKSDFYKNHEIENNISEIFFNNFAPEYEEKEFESVKKEGLNRFDNKIPPGYMDDEKDENGDYYIFKSLIDYCKKNKKDLIFITNDKKEDWFRNISGIKEPREELLSEFYKETGQKLMIFDFDNFIKNDVIFKKKISEEVASEIYEINKLQEKVSIREIQRIQRYLYLILKYNTIKEVQNNIDEVLKNYRTILRICEGMQDYPLIKKIEKLYVLLSQGEYIHYIHVLNNMKLQIKDYKVENEEEIKNMYVEFNKTLSVNIGLMLLEKISIYMRDYLDSSYDNRVLLSKARELRMIKRNEEIEDKIFIKETINIYNNFLIKIENKIESGKIYEQ